MENVFSALKLGRIALSAPLSDLLHQTVDFCYRLIDTDKPSSAEKTEIKQLIRQLDDVLPAEEDAKAVPEEPQTVEPEERVIRPVEIAALREEPPVPDSSPEPPERTPSASAIPLTAETVRISTAKLDALLLQTEEMISVKLATGQRAAELRELKKAFDLWKKERQREGTGGISHRRANADPLSADPFISSFETRLTALARAAEYDHRTSGTMVDMLLDDMKKALMLPFSSMLEMFPLFVRDLARAAGKKVELTTAGSDIEIDRRVLEEMKDPLIHLVRNCIDHGIETPAMRERKKKPARGNLRIGVASRDSKIEITVADDGAGIDVSTIISSAVKHATISQEAV